MRCEKICPNMQKHGCLPWLNLFKILPVGVVSKNDIRALSIELSRAVKKLLEALRLKTTGTIELKNEAMTLPTPNRV